nr:WPP domain-associated protein [Ipomoea batatas]
MVPQPAGQGTTIERTRWVALDRTLKVNFNGICEKDDVGKRLGEQVQMDDCPIVLGMEFLDSVNAVPIPCANTLAILGEKNGPCLVPLAREGSVKATQI